MNISEWIAVISICLTIIGSAVTFASWLSGRFARLETKVVLVENDWHEKLADTEKQLRKEMQDGPPWLKTLLERQEKLLEMATENAGIAIRVAEQHGQELNDIRRVVHEFGDKLDLLVAAVKKRQNYDS